MVDKRCCIVDRECLERSETAYLTLEHPDPAEEAVSRYCIRLENALGVATPPVRARLQRRRDESHKSDSRPEDLMGGEDAPICGSSSRVRADGMRPHELRNEYALDRRAAFHERAHGP